MCIAQGFPPASSSPGCSGKRFHIAICIVHVTGRLVELEQCLINTLQHKAPGSDYITVLVTLYCLRHLQMQCSLNQLGSYERGFVEQELEELV